MKNTKELNERRLNEIIKKIMERNIGRREDEGERKTSLSISERRTRQDGLKIAIA